MHKIISISLLTLIIFYSTAFADIWKSPVDLSTTGQSASSAAIAISKDGSTAIAIWIRSNGTKTIVQAATGSVVNNSITWSAPLDLSAAGQNANNPKVAISSDGAKATAIWTRNNGSKNIVQTSSAVINNNVASWSNVSDLSSTSKSADSPDIKLTPDGTKATAVWKYDTYGTIQSASATISGNTPTWGTVSDIFTTTGTWVEYSRIGLSNDGTKATAVWMHVIDGFFIVESASAIISGNSQTWGAVTHISELHTDSINPQLGLSSDGSKAAVSWGAAFYPGTVTGTISGTTASWNTPNLSQYYSTGRPKTDINISSNGNNVTVIWDNTLPFAPDYPRYIKSASAIFGSSIPVWSSQTNIVGGNVDVTQPYLDVSSDGSVAFAVWTHSSSNYFVQASYGLIEGSVTLWSAPIDISAAGQSATNPEIAVSLNGSVAVAIWQRSNGTNTIIQAALASVNVPTPVPTATPTRTATATYTFTPTSTSTPTYTNTATSTNTPIPTVATAPTTNTGKPVITPTGPVGKTTPTQNSGPNEENLILSQKGKVKLTNGVLILKGDTGIKGTVTCKVGKKSKSSNFKMGKETQIQLSMTGLLKGMSCIATSNSKEVQSDSIVIK
jgi:hypothetical protein